MKKVMKISKILLLITVIFSYISSPITVLAEEVISMPLNLAFTLVDEDNDGYVDNYNLTYKSSYSEYVEEKGKSSYDGTVTMDADGKYTINLTDGKKYYISISEDAIATAGEDKVEEKTTAPSCK